MTGLRHGNAARAVGSPSGLAAVDAVRREPDDFYPTPPEATLALLGVERFPLRVWEPACGDGAIAKVLVNTGHSVIATDLRDRGYGRGGVDFFDYIAPECEALITNPPFKDAERFIRHALAIGVCKSAYLLRLQFLEGDRRRRLFAQTPLARVWVFSRRIPRMHNPDYHGKKTSSLIAFAWFVWDAEHSGPPQVGWVNPVRDIFA